MNWLWLASLFLISSAHAGTVNCGQALKNAKLPVCVVVEDAPERGCGKDPLIPKGKQWVSRTQMRYALKENGASDQECLQTFSRAYPKDGCCRPEIPRTMHKSKTPAKSTPKAPGKKTK
jgi:hypothetical protein